MIIWISRSIILLVFLLKVLPLSSPNNTCADHLRTRCCKVGTGKNSIDEVFEFGVRTFLKGASPSYKYDVRLILFLSHCLSNQPRL